MTLDHVADSESLRKAYVKILKDEERNGLKLDWRTLSCVTYILTIYPTIVERVDTQKNVAQGFVEAGFISSLNNKVPDAHAILRTCRQPWQKEEKDEIVRVNFNRFMTETLALGQLTDGGDVFPINVFLLTQPLKGVKYMFVCVTHTASLSVCMYTHTAYHVHTVTPRCQELVVVCRGPRGKL